MNYQEELHWQCILKVLQMPRIPVWNSHRAAAKIRDGNMRTQNRLALAASLMIFATIGATAGEWRFHSSDGPNGHSILLSESLSTKNGCSGKKEACEQMFALNEWTYVRELCYEVDNAGIVKLTDPGKVMFFNTFKIPASSFKRIPTAKERLEAQQQKENEQMRRNTDELNRQFNEHQRQRQQQIQQQLRRLPMICNHLGDMTICD